MKDVKENYYKFKNEADAHFEGLNSDITDYVEFLERPDVIEKYIEITNNYPNLKLCTSGILNRISRSKGTISKDNRWMLQEISRLYCVGRKAWLEGDLDTVAQMFGVLVE